MPRPTVRAVWSASRWREIFDSVLDSELDTEDQWNLNFNYSLGETLTQEERRRGWKIHSSCTHADFECGSCPRTWHTAKSMLLVHYRLRGNRGTVIMRPFGQACRRCGKQVFERPGFSDREMEWFLHMLSSKILKNCYGVHDDNNRDFTGSRNIKKTDPHESSLCEACVAGLPCGNLLEGEQD